MRWMEDRGDLYNHINKLHESKYLVEHNGIAMAKFLTSRGFDVVLKPQGDLGHIYATRKARKARAR